ncbi:MAG: hypothetical protein ACTHOU_12830 [Aureliella sp.]|jgi:hypothetical protein
MGGDGRLGQTTAEITIVRGWLAAAKEQDVERLLALSLPGLEILGAAVQGTDKLALQQWMSDTQSRFTRERFFQRDESVVLGQLSPEAGTAIVQSAQTEPAAAAADPAAAHGALRFRVRELRVVEVEGYDDLASALSAAGLSTDDERCAGS